MATGNDNALGPSNSSDSGSDRAGATRQPGLPDPQTPVDKALRDDVPRSPLPEQVMSIEAEGSGGGAAAAEVSPDPDEDRDATHDDDGDDGDEHAPPEPEPHPTQTR